MIEKNTVIELKIEDMTKDGEGIGHFNGYTLFVKDAVIGDVITAKVMKAKKSYGYARLMDVLTPSPDRVEPPCPEARKCGGCQLMAMSYEAQLKFKNRLVENTLKRIGGFQDIKVEKIIGMDDPVRYRNKAQYPVGIAGGEIAAGFYARHSHNIMVHDDCLLSPKINNEITAAVIEWMEKYNIRPYDETTGEGLVRHILVREAFATGEILVCIVVNGTDAPHTEHLADTLMSIKNVVGVCLNVNKVRGNVILGNKNIRIAGNDYIEDKIGDVKYRISPLSFYQVNPAQTRKLYDTVKEFAALTGNEIVWDLYCGIGTISLYTAKKARGIIGIEVIPQAVDDAKVNAGLNGIKNAKYYAGTAEEVMPEILKQLDEQGFGDNNVAIVDPPRKGCDRKLINALLELSPDRIVYVSCDPATLARDMRILSDGGYEVVKVQPVDMFPHTVHVETVCLLSRNK